MAADLAVLNRPLEEALPHDGRLLGALGRLKIRRVMDLLNHFPRSYNQRAGIAELEAGMHASICGEVVTAANKATKNRRMKITEVIVSDGTGSITAVFFNQPWLTGKLQPGLRVRMSGPVDYAYHQWTMRPSSFELNAAPEEAGLEAEYPLTEGLDNRDLAHTVAGVLSHAAAVPDPLPAELAAQLRLMPIEQAYRHAHQPQDRRMLDAALLALKYREFFMMQVGLRLRRRSEAADTDMVLKVTGELQARVLKYFPFAFTGAQRRVCGEIEQDLQRPGRMHRLLQGDVGSGKTAVALYTALLFLDNGYQCAVLAPTEVLARQHFNNFRAYLRGSKVRVELLTGGLRKNSRDALCADLADGRIHIVVGTHALLEDYVKFKRLGLCVFDEQHKFGVNQRATLRAKGNRPHLLAMSATPIPRTLSMTLYGAMDVSLLDELPPGRTPVITEWVHRAAERRAYEKIRAELKDGGRAYFVYPLVEASEALELKSATEYAETLKNEHFPECRVGVVHGQMDAEEKDRVMERFRKGALDILAATVVVEVGVDVPEANVMVIENAERFGLAQLHQLRGRVGRGKRQSYLYLFGEPRTDEAIRRLRVICETTDGFKIAEEDLRMRGFGDFAGTRQSGLPRLHAGDFERDLDILARARRDAARWAEKVDEALLRECLALHYGRAYRLLDV
ncbi:MAG: ATP-dependent DNA helicase RecG [Planctomycetes bacterium]|nr:ATP-dependent DNA helicase RecG [Planctomycetota bacterium]